MGREEIVYNADYSPEDYTVATISEWAISSPAEAFVASKILGEEPLELQYRVILPEFEIEYVIKKIKHEQLMPKILSRIEEEMKKLKKKGKDLPVPMKFCTEHSGRITLRISPYLHKKLYVESLITKTSINNLIEKKLRNET